MKTFFNAVDENGEHGVPLSTLQAGIYKDVMTIGQYLDLPTPVLKEKCTVALKAARRRPQLQHNQSSMSALSPGIAPGASVMGKPEDDDIRLAEILLRILRMR